MKANEELFKAWSQFLQQEKDLLTEDELTNLQNVDFCRNHRFLGRYDIPVIRLKTLVENDRDADGRFYKRFFLFDKYSISNDWYHSKTETNRREFFIWFADFCKQRNVYNKLPSIIKEEVEREDNKVNDQPENLFNDIDNKQKKDKSSFNNERGGGRMILQRILFGAPGTGKSFKIDDKNGYDLKAVNEHRKFRTTFHPDYDYAQFVGAYKPLKTHNSSVLNKNELIERLKEMKKNDSYPVHKFSALYFDSLLKLSNADLTEIVKETDTPDSKTVEFKKGIAVGEYLKSKRTSSSITYSFVPQVFAKAYATAWKLQLDSSPIDKRVFLVIEEINRGNCAQIFGDIFQLLDRDVSGASQYSIDADNDFAEWLEKEFTAANLWDAYKKEVGGEGKLKLPPNLNILATMNTSDQSLFPMDSAFKRRFDWEYVPISFDGKDAANFQIDIDGAQYSWQKFVETVNEKILTLTESEDKQLGEFFIKPESGNVISKDRFLGKVMFYLWNEVCKDEHNNGSFFRAKDKDGKEKFFTFQDLYRDKELLKRFMDELLSDKPEK